MICEVWKPIPGYEGFYEISSHGSVRSVDRNITYKDGREYFYKGKTLVPRVDRVGCKYVHLYINGKRRAFTIHRLVAIAFIENIENLSDVNHIDGNRLNNRVSNLEWCTHAENMQHAFRTGLINNTGVNHGNNIYTDDQILKVKEMLVLRRPHKEIEAETGVKKGTVEQISQGRQWRHL